jgi:hypothetical protein
MLAASKTKIVVNNTCFKPIRRFVMQSPLSFVSSTPFNVFAKKLQSH